MERHHSLVLTSDDRAGRGCNQFSCDSVVIDKVIAIVADVVGRATAIQGGAERDEVIGNFCLLTALVIQV
jgi:hypothetical protein